MNNYKGSSLKDLWRTSRTWNSRKKAG